MDLSAWVLSKVFQNTRVVFMEKIAVLEKASEAEQSYAFADLADFVKSLSRLELSEIFSSASIFGLSAERANYVAAMLEMRARQMGVPTPQWLFDIEPLSVPYFGTELKSLRPYLLQVSQAPFKSRNIYIDTALGRV